MRTSLMLTSLATFAVSLMIGNLSPAYAANCETKLKSLYICTATSEKGPPELYTMAADPATLGDGHFSLSVGMTAVQHCTCIAKGTPPHVRFGVSKDFFCNGTDIVAMGKVESDKLKGQMLSATGNRFVFTCEEAQTM
jgi:hypothetical protein